MQQGANRGRFASLPRWCGYCDLVNAPENRSFGRAKSGLIAEETRTPISAHGQGLNFEGELAHVHVFANFAGGSRVARGVFQISQPFLHKGEDAIANGARAIIEFERGGREKAAAGESFLFAVRKPIIAECAKKAEAAELRGGAHDFFDEDVTGLVHDSALQIFFGAEVGEEAALADAQGSGELTDGEALEAFERSDIDGFAEDGAAGFEAAGAARAIISRRCGGLARTGGTLCGVLHCHSDIIARPFVPLQWVRGSRNPAAGAGPRMAGHRGEAGFRQRTGINSRLRFSGGGLAAGSPCGSGLSPQVGEKC